MRIAYVCSDRGVPVHGPSGSSVHLRSLASALAGAGAEVSIVAARKGDGESPCVEEARPGEVASLLLSGDAVSRELGQALAAAEVTRRLGRLHREAPFDLVYERWSLWGTGGIEFARHRRIPFFLEVNAPLVDEALRHRGLKLEAAARAIERLLLTRAERVFTVSRPLAAYAGGAGVPRERVVVTPNGVDPALFASLERRAGAAGVLRVGFVGSLKPWHGVPVLIEAIRRVHARRPVQLVVAGDGPLRPELEAAAAELGSGVIEWVGTLAHEQVPLLLSTCHVAVAPYAEADVYFSPLKVVEAMAAGACVVASRSGDLDSTVRDGETGILVAPGDPEALARALLSLEADRDRASRLGAAARAEVLATRTWPQVARRVLDELAAVRAEPVVEGVHAG